MPFQDETAGGGAPGAEQAPGETADDLAWLTAFRAEHPDVSVHSTSRGVWFADGPDWRVYGRALPEFLDKLRNRFPLQAAETDR
jgi:hypothetical protein